MVVVAVKKFCSKSGKRYGPYPKDPEIFYLYRVQRHGDKITSRYLGKGPKPSNTLVRENRSVNDVRATKYLRYPERVVVQENVKTKKTGKSLIQEKTRKKRKR